MKYRNKVETVEAEVYDGLPPATTKTPGICKNKNALHLGCPDEPHVHSYRSRHAILVDIGDYVVKEPDGTGYCTMNPALFEQRYEEATSD